LTTHGAEESRPTAIACQNKQDKKKKKKKQVNKKKKNK